MKQLLIDIDHTLDDALALISAFSQEEMEVVGITTAGQANGEQIKNRPTEILEALDWDVRIAVGVEESLSEVISERGSYGDIDVMPVALEQEILFEEMDAADLIYELARESGQLTILLLGPATNLAVALERYPDLPEYIDDVFMMGGSLRRGNITEFAEHHFYADPVAVNLIIKSRLTVFMIGLDVTEEIYIQREEIDAFEAPKDDKAVLFHRTLEPMMQSGEANLQKSLALYAVLYPDAFIFQEKNLWALEKGERRGQLIEKERVSPCYVAVSVNVDQARTWILSPLGALVNESIL